MFNAKALLLMNPGTYGFPENCRLKRTFMDHTSTHDDHGINWPKWRDGHGSLGGVNIRQIITSGEHGSKNGRIYLEQEPPGNPEYLYVYYLEAQRYMKLRRIRTGAYETKDAWIFRIYETDHKNPEFRNVPSSDDYPTLFVSPKPMPQFGTPITSEALYESYEKNFKYIDYSKIDPTWGLG